MWVELTGCLFLFPLSVVLLEVIRCVKLALFSKSYIY